MPGPDRISLRNGGPAGAASPASEQAARKPAADAASGGSGGDRGQTTLDFAMGVVIFLAVILFIFAFVPGILEPFNISGEQDTVLSERIASQLSQGALGDPATPYVLESSCTVAFFADGDSPPSRCHFEGDDLHERVDVERYRNVNVSIEAEFGSGTEIACWDADSTNQELVGQSDGDCSPGGASADQRLAIGDDRPISRSATITSRRIVSLHQRNVTMEVVVW